MRYPVDAGLVGDSKRVLLRTAAAPSGATTNGSFLKASAGFMKEWRELMIERATRTDMPMKPQVVTHQLNKLLRRRCDRHHR